MNQPQSLLVAFATLISISLVAGCGAGGAESDSETLSSVNGLDLIQKDGRPAFPADFRGAGWTHLGSWAIQPKDGDNVHQLHHSYAQTSAVESFQKTGKWPDGAILVKELRGVSPAGMTTGFVAGGGELVGYFVMVKRAEKPATDTPYWGDGWYGAQYNAGDLKKDVSGGWLSCKGCHLPVKDTDWVFTSGYPVLKN